MYESLWGLLCVLVLLLQQQETQGCMYHTDGMYALGASNKKATRTSGLTLARALHGLGTDLRIQGAAHERTPTHPTSHTVVGRRDFFLIPENYKGCRSLLVSRCGELLRKIWNTRNFKGQVCLGVGACQVGDSAFFSLAWLHLQGRQ